MQLPGAVEEECAELSFVWGWGWLIVTLWGNHIAGGKAASGVCDQVYLCQSALSQRLTVIPLQMPAVSPLRGLLFRPSQAYTTPVEAVLFLFFFYFTVRASTLLGWLFKKKTHTHTLQASVIFNFVLGYWRECHRAFIIKGTCWPIRIWTKTPALPSQDTEQLED